MQAKCNYCGRTNLDKSETCNGCGAILEIDVITLKAISDWKTISELYLFTRDEIIENEKDVANGAN